MLPSVLIPVGFFLLAAILIAYRLLHLEATAAIETIVEQRDPYVLSFRQYCILQYIADYEKSPARRTAKWDDIYNLVQEGLVYFDRYRETELGYRCLQLSKLMYSSKIARLKYSKYNASRDRSI